MTTDQKVTGLNPVGVTKTICVNGAACLAAPIFLFYFGMPCGNLLIFNLSDSFLYVLRTMPRTIFLKKLDDGFGYASIAYGSFFSKCM